MPGAKNGERPYLAVPVPSFLDPFFGIFYSHFISSPPIQHFNLYFYIYNSLMFLSQHQLIEFSIYRPNTETPGKPYYYHT